MPTRPHCFKLLAEDGGTVPTSRRANHEWDGSCRLDTMSSMALKLLLSTVTMGLGAFVAGSPQRAAKFWGSQRLANLAPERRASFVREYRVFGILLCLTGVLLAVDSIVFETIITRISVFARRQRTRMIRRSSLVGHANRPRRLHEKKPRVCTITGRLGICEPRGLCGSCLR